MPIADAALDPVLGLNTASFTILITEFMLGRAGFIEAACGCELPQLPAVLTALDAGALVRAH